VNFRSGRHFLQLPGPTNVPDRVLRAMDRATIDHRGAEFAEMTGQLLSSLNRVFGGAEHVFIFPSSATGAWEAAMVNTLSPGDRVLMFDHGFFANNWRMVAERLGVTVDFVAGDWRCAVAPSMVEAKLAEDQNHQYRAVMIVHNETSTGVVTDVAGIREAMNRAQHPALLLVDTVSSLASMEYEHRAWGVDVTVSGSQKGLMLPPGLSFNAVSQKALDGNAQATLPQSYWRWDAIREFNERGFFPYTPATNLLYGLLEAVTMLHEEGLPRVFARHARLAEATRRAVKTWGLEIFAREPAERSQTVTTVFVPDGLDADTLRRVILERFDMSLGSGLGALKGKVFRVGHLGDFNDLMLAGTLSGIEMGLQASGVRAAGSGVTAALEFLASEES